MADGPWILQPDGKVLAQPVLGYASAALPKAGLLRIDYAANEEDFRARRATTVQLAMGADHAREIAAALNRIADQIDPPRADFRIEDSPSVTTMPGRDYGPPSGRPEPVIDYRIEDEADEPQLNYRI